MHFKYIYLSIDKNELYKIVSVHFYHFFVSFGWIVFEILTALKTSLEFEKHPQTVCCLNSISSCLELTFSKPETE